jgi:DNA-binding MarR family transcriptional regulator
MPVDPGTARELIHGVFDLQRVIRCLSATELKHGDLGVASQGVLRMIAEHGGRAVDLAGQLGVSAPVLSRHLAELEGLGFVARHRDPDDRRAQRVALTDAGATVLKEIEEHRIGRLQSYLAGWDEEQAGQAVLAIGQLSDALRAGARRMRPAPIPDPAAPSDPALPPGHEPPQNPTRPDGATTTPQTTLIQEEALAAR